MAKKSPNEVVQDVLHGLYGVADTRKQKLRDAGYSWIEIQSLINKQYSARPVAATNAEIAQEIKEGRWGEEGEWKDRVTNAGFNWAQIAPLVKSTSTPTTSSGTAATTPSSSGAALISNTVQSKGIDISAWQGTVDFKRAKAAGVEFVILREGFSTSIDKYFLEYVRGAKNAGIPIHGVYHFAYATSKEGASQEAQSCMANVVKAGLPKGTIIFYDFEYDTIANARKKGVTLGKQQCIEFTNEFCSVVAANGYKPGIYCNLDYYRNMYDIATTSKYILWIAQWTKGEPSVKGAYHQYSDQGRIDGINTNVDLDTCYIRNAAVAAPASDTTAAKPSVPDSGSNTAVPNTSNPTTSNLSDFTKYNGKISNCGKDEYGGISGGRAGDQTGKEWWIINWYSQGWQCVLRHPSRKVREYIAELGIQAALNDNVGYDQSQNRTYWEQLQQVGYWPKNIKTPCETDCSAGVTTNVKAVGYLLDMQALKDVTITYTGAMRSELRAAGFQVLTDRKYLSGPDYLLPGDIILNDSQHTATCVGYGKYTADQAAAPAEPEVPSNPNEHKVKPTMLNVRENPGLTNKIVAQLPKGTLVNIKQTVTAADGSKWHQIDQGYVAAQYIS